MSLGLGAPRLSAIPTTSSGQPTTSRTIGFKTTGPSGGAGAGGGISGLVDGMSGLSMRGSDANVRGSGMMARGFGMGGPGGIGRRSSTFTGRPSSISVMGAGGSSVPTKDPRPIRDKTWQANAIRTLINFLVQAGYNQPVSAKTLQPPSGKDFQTIFKFLYAQLDPCYVYQKKFEEEVPVILKGLRYPFADQIGKSHLYSVGSMHAWPTLLAMLTWMVELILCCDQLDNQGDFDDGVGPDGMAAGGASTHPEKIFFEYLTKAYAVFLAGGDDYDAMDAELMANFGISSFLQLKKNEMVLRDIERLTRENELLQKEWTTLSTAEPPVVTLEKEKALLESDLDKFRKYLAHLEGKKSNYVEVVGKMKEEFDAKEAELASLQKERAELQVIVDTQEISPADVDRMTAEREQLAKQIEAVNAKTEEGNKICWEKEIALQRKMDQLEKLIQEFNSRAYNLGLLATAAIAHADSDSEQLRFDELELRVHAARPQQMTSLDLKNQVKPILNRLRANFNSAYHKAADDDIALQDKLDGLCETVAEKVEALAAIEKRIQKLGEQYNEEKE
ncbi:kinetochore-associated Ndc80 complex subunit ndc80, partial [Quaeritorhiza haematococci]